MHEVLHPHHKRGFTLVELIVSIAILGVLMSAALSFFVFGNSFSKREISQYYSQADVRLLIDQLVSEVQYSTELSIVPVNTAVNAIAGVDDSNYIFEMNGEIYKSIYNNGSRAGNILLGRVLEAGTSFSSIVGSPDHLAIQISSMNGTQTYTANAKVKLVNFGLFGNTSAVSGGTGLALKYKVSSFVPPVVTENLITNIVVSPLSGPNNIIISGGQLQMKASILPITAMGTPIIWSVDNETIATIDSTTGLLTAIANGNVLVTATSTDSLHMSSSVQIAISGQIILPLSISNIINGSGTVQKGTIFTFTPVIIGGTPPYVVSYPNPTCTAGTIGISNSVITWSTTNANGKKLTFVVSVSDSSTPVQSVSYPAITITTN